MTFSNENFWNIGDHVKTQHMLYNAETVPAKNVVKIKRKFIYVKMFTNTLSQKGTNG